MRTFRRVPKPPFGQLGVMDLEYHGDVPFITTGMVTGRRYVWEEVGKKSFCLMDYKAMIDEEKAIFGKKVKPKEGPKESKE